MTRHNQSLLKSTSATRLEGTPRTAVVSLCARRQHGRISIARVQPPAPSAAHKLSLTARASNAASACANVGLMMVLWPVAKLAGVFDWSDFDERD
jgi:hypothetical protein